MRITQIAPYSNGKAIYDLGRITVNLSSGALKHLANRMGASKGFKKSINPPLNTEAPKGAIGFAPGTANDAVRNIGRIDHAGRHLSDFGVIAGNQGTKAFREAVRSNAIRILENPLKTFNHVIGGQQVKGFYGMIDGKRVVFFVAKEPRGKIGTGELVTAVVPSPQQIINWGL